MPTAKLLYPRSLQTGGFHYHKNVVVPVDEETAKALAEDPRFFVEGLDGHSSEAKIAALLPKSVAEKIREAADQLDADVEGNFTSDGRPSAAALSQALGEEISQHQVDVALGLGGKGRVVIREVAKVEAPPVVKPRIKKVKLTPKVKEPVVPGPATPGAGAGDSHDSSTDGAIPAGA